MILGMHESEILIFVLCMIFGFIYTLRRRQSQQSPQPVQKDETSSSKEEEEEEEEKTEEKAETKRKRKRRKGRIRFSNMDPQATMPINSKEPVQFENDRVRGQCLLMIRPPDVRNFVHRERMFSFFLHAYISNTHKHTHTQILREGVDDLSFKFNFSSKRFQRVRYLWVVNYENR
jgi:hypothetical protein